MIIDDVFIPNNFQWPLPTWQEILNSPEVCQAILTEITRAQHKELYIALCEYLEADKTIAYLESRRRSIITKYFGGKLLGQRPEIPYCGPSWSKIRHLVFHRDGGKCQVCGFESDDPECFECGHIIPRMLGGPDSIANCVVMCGLCNRCLKPDWEHDNLDTYIEWVKEIQLLGIDGYIAKTYLDYVKAGKIKI